MSFYQNYLERHHLKDFDDLLIDYLNWIQIKKHKTYTYLFVDEFQDTNELQYNILKALIDEAYTCIVCWRPLIKVFINLEAQTHLLSISMLKTIKPLLKNLR